MSARRRGARRKPRHVIVMPCGCTDDLEASYDFSVRKCAPYRRFVIAFVCICWLFCAPFSHLYCICRAFFRFAPSIFGVSRLLLSAKLTSSNTVYWLFAQVQYYELRTSRFASRKVGSMCPSSKVCLPYFWFPYVDVADIADLYQSHERAPDPLCFHTFPLRY